MAPEVLSFIAIISQPLSLCFLNKMFKWIAIWYSSVHSVPYNTSTDDSILVLVLWCYKQHIYYTNKLDSSVGKCKLTALTLNMLLWIQKNT